MMRSTYSCWLPVSPLSPPVPSHEPGHNRGMWVPVTMSWWQAKLFPVTPQHLVRWLSLAGSLRQTARPSSYLPSLVLTLLHTEICSMTRSSVKTIGTGHQHDRVVRVFFQSPWHVIYICVCVFRIHCFSFCNNHVFGPLICRPHAHWARFPQLFGTPFLLAEGKHCKKCPV